MFAPIGAVFGEWAGADSGLGLMILLRTTGSWRPRASSPRPRCLVAIALALFALIALAERRVVTWR